MSFGNWIKGFFTTPDYGNRGELEDQASQSKGAFQSALNKMISRGESLSDEPRLTAEDLFGDSLQRTRDSIGSSANATKQALSRAMLSGGDVTGAGGAQILNVDQKTANELGSTGLQFSQLADQVNRQRQGRGDRLLSQGLQGLQNLFSSDQGLLQQFIQRRLQQSQAKKQSGANLLGNIIQGGTTLLAACWVAIELYGEDDHRTHAIRGMLAKHEGSQDEIDEFLDFYKGAGQDWANQIKENKVLRLQTERLFDNLYELSKAA